MRWKPGRATIWSIIMGGELVDEAVQTLSEAKRQCNALKPEQIVDENRKPEVREDTEYVKEVKRRIENGEFD